MISAEDLKGEKKYLAGVVNVLEKQLEDINNLLYESEKLLNDTSKYMSDSFYEVDVEEQAVSKQIQEQLQLNYLELVKNRDLKERQKQSAYFGRIDFKASDEDEVYPYYIGIAHVLEKGQVKPYVLDWRAPLSSMYYDYELGKASYQAPCGKITGQIYLKRQYKTNNKKLEYAFDSNLTIGDEILKNELGKGASAKMKNIVATIQAEQNKIIRANEFKSTIVQGVAGSGKTSIALHRVAYLLYNNQLKAEDILIISPSTLFSDYISNVLPELGEQNSPKITFDEIARSELNNIVHFEPKSQMLEDVLNGNKNRAIAVQHKSTFKFFEQLQKYLEKTVSVSFVAKDIKVGKTKIKAEEINVLYNERYLTKAPSVRIEWIADYIVDKLEIGRANAKAVFERVKRVLLGMFKHTNLVKIYEEFLHANNITCNFVKLGKEVYVGYEDMPAILYIKDYLLGVAVDKNFKHIIIDEMQDYSPIAMAILQKMYPATKTILGDTNQMFEKNAEANYLKKIAHLVDGASIFKLNTTYRSTLQIAKHNQKIIGLKGVNNFNREGDEVKYIKPTKLVGEVEKLCKKFESVAVICPNIKKANQVFEKIGEKLNFVLIDENSGKVKDQKVVIPAVYSKGLEFDAVVFVGDKDCAKNADVYCNTKYIACTRALHKLIVVED